MAGLLDSVAGNLLGRISVAAGRSEFRQIQSELRNLESTVSNLKAGLRDAEEKQASNGGLSDPLKKLKAAFSMADDLIEDLECKYLEWKVQNRKNSVNKMVRQHSSCFSSNFLVSANKIAAEINLIVKKLDLIDEIMSNFSLVEDETELIKRSKSEMTLRTSITGSQVFARLLHLKKEAILSDNVDFIVGRDEEKHRIIDELVMAEEDKPKSSDILSIHGDGGIGKTALAKLVYNANEVFDHFDKRMWVCVSEDLDVQRIKREILSSATGEKVSDAVTDHRIQTRLERNFVGRKFLLVLDDFGDLDPGRVLELKKIVKMGANGSKIIVTTRSVQTLNDATSITPHKIEGLDEEKSKELFDHIFRNKNLTEKLESMRSEIKEKLVPKCGGAPLAIKCLAGLLSSQASDGVECLNVKDLSEGWLQEGKKGGWVLRALKLNYDLMPSYLKPCFLCFSLLPKDYVFYSFELIQLWMAQGILHSVSKDPEAVGEQYFNELWSLGLLEDVEEHALGYWFKIHTLVHDLAVEQANEEQTNLESLHQLSFVDCINKDLPPSTSNEIRFLSIPVRGIEPKINEVPLVKCITKFRQLRFLYLCNSSFEEIPTSIETLKHLRYLDLRGNQRLKRLPESICKLQSLQTLILAFCSGLEEIPKNIKNMISLRFLWIHTKQASLGKDGIGSLTSLRFLAIGGSENLTHLFEDIDKLSSLQTLILYDCKSLVTLPIGLEGLISLSNMAIWGCEQLRFTFSMESLRLKKLILRGSPTLAILPRWMEHSYENLEVLEVGEFPRLRVLPIWLSNLWELRILGISNCPRLEDHMPPNMKYCDKIKELRITFCGALSRKGMKTRNHVDLDISHIPTIYVDSKKIKLSLPLTEEHEAGEAAQTEESVADHVGLNSNGDRGVGSKHDRDDIHGFIQDQHGEENRGKHDGATNNNQHNVHGFIRDQHNEQTRRKHDGATTDDQLKIHGFIRDQHNEQTRRKHDGATTDDQLKIHGFIRDQHNEQTIGKHDGATNDNQLTIHGGFIRDQHEEQMGRNHDGATNDNQLKIHGFLRDQHGEPMGGKHDGATNGNQLKIHGLSQHQHDKQMGGKHDEATNKNQLKIHGSIRDQHREQTGRKHDGATNDNRLEIHGLIRDQHDEQTRGKHDGTTNDNQLKIHRFIRDQHDEQTGRKHDGATNDNQLKIHRFIRGQHDEQTERKHDGATNNYQLKVGQAARSARDEATDYNNHHCSGQIVGVKLDGVAGIGHIGTKPAIGEVQDKAVDDSHVGDGQIGGARLIVGTNKKHVELVGNFGVQLGGGNGSGHDGVCLFDNNNNHDGPEQPLVVTLEGF